MLGFDVDSLHITFLIGRVKVGDDCFEVAFGLPWNFENFVTKATELGHPANFWKRIPADMRLIFGSF